MFAMVDVEGRRKKAEVNPPPAPPRGEIQEEGRRKKENVVTAMFSAIEKLGDCTCRVPRILFSVGTRHCRLLYILMV